ncbi:hypothetical protein IIA79_05690, partial [bacterium]|nr:hypothetical protein [bacterium]
MHLRILHTPLVLSLALLGTACGAGTPVVLPPAAGETQPEEEWQPGPDNPVARTFTGGELANFDGPDARDSEALLIVRDVLEGRNFEYVLEDYNIRVGPMISRASDWRSVFGDGPGDIDGGSDYGWLKMRVISEAPGIEQINLFGSFETESWNRCVREPEAHVEVLWEARWTKDGQDYQVTAIQSIRGLYYSPPFGFGGWSLHRDFTFVGEEPYGFTGIAAYDLLTKNICLQALSGAEYLFSSREETLLPLYWPGMRPLELLDYPPTTGEIAREGDLVTVELELPRVYDPVYDPNFHSKVSQSFAVFAHGTFSAAQAQRALDEVSLVSEPPPPAHALESDSATSFTIDWTLTIRAHSPPGTSIDI